MKVKVPRNKNQTPLLVAIRNLIYNPAMLDILMKKEVYHENTGEILKSLLSTIEHDSGTRFIQNRRFLIVTVARGREENMRHYRDYSGSSLLHIVCQRTWEPSLLYWLKELLHIGLDPSETNNYNQTALDVRITSFWSGVWSCYYSA